MQATDPVTDSDYTQIGRIAETFDMPDFVKQASAEQWDSLPAGAYAGCRTFPVHTKVATWLSSAYFAQNKDRLRKAVRRAVRPRLKAAAESWGIDFEGLQKAAEAPEPDMPHLLDKEVGGQRWQLFPVPDRRSIEKAASALHGSRSKLPYPWRKEAAEKLLDLAEEKGVHLEREDYLLKAAGRGATSPRDAAGHILRRSKLVENSDLRRKLEKFAVQLSEDPFDHDDLVKCAEMVGQIDEHFRLNEKYEDGLPTPEECFFGRTIKDAREEMENYVELPNGRLVHRSQVKKASLLQIGRAVGGEFEDKVSESMMPGFEELQKAASALSEDDADTVCRLLPEPDEDLEEWSFLKGAVWPFSGGEVELEEELPLEDIVEEDDLTPDELASIEELRSSPGAVSGVYPSQLPVYSPEYSPRDWKRDLQWMIANSDIDPMALASELEGLQQPAEDEERRQKVLAVVEALRQAKRQNRAE